MKFHDAMIVGIVTATPLTVLAFVFVGSTGAGPPPPPGWSGDVTVVRVLDGDTVEVEVKYLVKVRLADCWAPEVRTKDLEIKRRGLLAKQGMADLVFGKTVRLVVPTTGRLEDSLTFGRVVGRIWVGQVDVAERMVKLGLATKTKGGQ